MAPNSLYLPIIYLSPIIHSFHIFSSPPPPIGMKISGDQESLCQKTLTGVVEELKEGQ